MRGLISVFVVLVCIVALTWAAAVEQTIPNNVAATSLLEVDSNVDHQNEGIRQTRQFFGGFYRPYYGYYGGYYRPYYGYGYYRPYYGFHYPYYAGYGFYG